ncbi:radical SAM protein [Candidatus Gracilibacteria bacterium]|nr:radical SAM protein [Candidatus Gracilibacteria bacterium]
MVQKNHSEFLELGLEKNLDFYCSAGSNKFLIYTQGEVYRCFGLSEIIGNIDDISFIYNFQKESRCLIPSCHIPCDNNCEKWIVNKKTNEKKYFESDFVDDTDSSAQQYHSLSHRSISLERIEFCLVPTMFCNFSCSYCISGSNEIDKKLALKKVLSCDRIINFLENIKKEIKENKKISIILSGGEPLLWCDIISFSKYCSEELDKTINLKINTNSSLLEKTKEILDIYEKNAVNKKNLMFQISAHIQEKNFNEKNFFEVCNTIKEYGVRYHIVIIKDKNDMSKEKRDFIRSVWPHPYKILSDFNYQPKDKMYVKHSMLNGYKNEN